MSESVCKRKFSPNATNMFPRPSVGTNFFPVFFSIFLHPLSLIGTIIPRMVFTPFPHVFIVLLFISHKCLNIKLFHHSTGQSSLTMILFLSSTCNGLVIGPIREDSRSVSNRVACASYAVAFARSKSRANFTACIA